MRAFVHNLPRFSSAGSAGTRRILLTGAAVIGVVGVVVVVAMHQRSVEQPVSIAKAPPADQLPGGVKATPHYEDLAAEEERKRATAAAAQGKSSMARMAGGVPTDAIPMNAPDACDATSRTSAANRSGAASRKRARANSRRQGRAEAAAHR